MSTIQSRTQRKREKRHITLTWKFPWKSCSTTHLYVPFLLSNPKILKAFLKTFPKPTKKVRHEKQKKREGEKGKSKTQDYCVTFKCKILLSVLAQTLQANILHLDQTAMKCGTCMMVVSCLEFCYSVLHLHAIAAYYKLI